MNITELARRLRVHPTELLKKLPELGFSVGAKAIKIDNRQAQKIMEAWSEMSRKNRLAQKMEMQKSHGASKDALNQKEKKVVSIPSVVTVREFATFLDLPVPRVMQELMRNGILASINERIDFETASILGSDLGFQVELETKKADQVVDEIGLDKIQARKEQEKDTVSSRPPVVVVMGHVDHGKTKLLDAIRKTNIVESEAGGITQHIGAYQVERNGKMLTFIDTPGHEAFTVMRSRGAKVADIAILVVAADDGVQPQTKEAVNIIKSAGLPFIVALNKIDRKEANLDHVKSQLSDLGLTPEDWGGKTIVVPVSAKEGKNLEQLLDMLLLVSDMEKEKITADANNSAIGTVIESHVESGSGPVATVLVQSGTLRVGDVLGVREMNYGKVRAMKNWKKDSIQTASPSTPAEIIGWKIAPVVGDVMEVPKDATLLQKLKYTDSSNKATEEVASIKSHKSEHEPKHILPLIIRADMLGSLEAILGMLDKVQHPEVGVRVIKKGLGNITETDITEAEASKALVFGFNVKPGSGVFELSREKNVDIRQYQVIYRLFDDVLEGLKKLLPSELVITELGMFEVLKVFRKIDHGWIIGGKVKKSKILPKAKLRLSRNGEYVGEGEIVALQLGQAELKEGQPGQEIGLSYKGKVKPEEGDLLEAYQEEKILKELIMSDIHSR